MRKRFASLMLTLALVAGTALPALGAAAPNDYTPYAESLSALGVFKGTSGGFELERTPQRSEGVAMLVRLMGAEDEAQAMKDEEIPFTDADGWARGYIAYVWKNQLANGVGGTSFGSSNLIDAQSFTTLILRSLGYRDKEGDFTYTSAVEFAASIGLFDEAFEGELTGSVFNRGQIARICYEALRFPMKGTETPLAGKLSADGKLDAGAVERFLAAPKDGVESDDTDTLTFIKSGDGPAYYADAPWCPDFGAMSGSRLTYSPVSDDGIIHAYYYVVEKDGMVTKYDELLCSLGYEYDWEFAEGLTAFNAPVAYVHPDSQHIVVIDVDKDSGEFIVCTS